MPPVLAEGPTIRRLSVMGELPPAPWCNHWQAAGCRGLGGETWGGPMAERPGQPRHKAQQGLVQGQTRWQPARVAMVCQALSWLSLPRWELGLAGAALRTPGTQTPSRDTHHPADG